MVHDKRWIGNQQRQGVEDDCGLENWGDRGVLFLVESEVCLSESNSALGKAPTGTAHAVWTHAGVGGKPPSTPPVLK